MNWPTPEGYENWQDWAQDLVAVLAQFEASLQARYEVGQIGEFIVLPSGWLLCNGATFNAASFPALFNKLGSNTLPNLTAQYDVTHVVGIKT